MNPILPSNTIPEETDYLAFISYRHADNTEEDRQWATWLHQQLEVYDIPADLIGTKNQRGETIPERIYPVFRDEVSLPADADLASAISTALDHSRFLIVLCSPRAVQSHYVNEEILHFKQTGKQERIIAALLLGEPNASIDASKQEDPEDVRTLECFPKALQHPLNANGELDIQQRAEPIAANFRLLDGSKGLTNPNVYKQLLLKQGRDAKTAERLANSYEEQLNNAKLKIIAGILGVPLEQLTQRDKIHQLNKARIANKRLLWIAAVMSVLILVAGGTGGFAYSQWKRAEQQNQRAQKLLGEIRSNLHFMNFELRDVMKKYVPQHARIQIMQHIDDIVGSLEQYGSKKPEELRLKAVALFQKADQLLKTNQLNPEQALKLYQQGLELFEQLAKQHPSITQFQRDLSTSYTNLGNIQLRLGNTNAALKHYQASLKLSKTLVQKDPSNTLFQRDLSDSYSNLGTIQLRLGNTNAALKLYQTSLELAKTLVQKDPSNTQLQGDLSASYNKLGTIQLRLGDTAPALKHYQASLELHKTLAQKDPSNTQFQRDLSISYSTLGNIQLRLGNTHAALKLSQASLELHKTLIQKDPSNTQLQRDLSVSYNKLGTIQLRLGDTAAALKLYQAGLELHRTLLQKDPSNIQLQRDLSVSYDNHATIQLRLGNTDAVLKHYQASLELRKSLLQQDPGNTQFQRDLSVSNTKLGIIKLRLGDTDTASKHYQASLELHKTLIQKDPSNTQFQRDLSVSYTNLGNIQLRLGNTHAALKLYQAGLELLKTLAQKDPNNTQLQRDLSASYGRLGNIQLRQGDTDAASKHYQAGLEFTKTLAQQDPNNTQLQRDLSVSYDNHGTIQLRRGDTDAALRHYQASLELRKTLAQKDPRNTQFQRDIGFSHHMIAEIFSKTKYYHKAISHFRQVIQYAPNKGSLMMKAWGNMGWYQLLLGDFETAQQSTLKAYTMDPNSLAWGVNLAHTYWLHQHDLERAKSQFLEILPKIKEVSFFQQGPMADFTLFAEKGWCPQGGLCRTLEKWLPIVWQKELDSR